MIKKLFIAVVILSSFVACNSKTAFNYSQGIVKKERSLTTDISMAESKLIQFMEKQQYDSVAAVATRMEKLVDGKLTEIKTEPAPEAKEGAAFKDASVKYFSYIKSMYTAFKDIGNASSDEAREKEIASIQKLDAQRTTVLSDMQSAQKKFAEANGFKLEDK